MRRRIVLYCFVLFLLSISLVVALECETIPTCEYQGYTMSVSDCVGKNILRCPREPDNDNAVYCGGRCQTKLVFDPLWDGQANTQALLTAILNNSIGSGYGYNYYGYGSGYYGYGSDYYDYGSGYYGYGSGYYGYGSGYSGSYNVSNYAADAANDYFVISENDPYFGKGKWYVPALGELVEAYGINYSDITQAQGTSGATGTNKTKINTALSAIRGVVSTTALTNYVWSSTERYTKAWYLDMDSGRRNFAAKTSEFPVRPFLLLKDKFEVGKSPAIGDIVYSDFSYSTAEAYDNSKTPVGVVAWVSPSGRSAKIISLTTIGPASRKSWYKNADNILAIPDYSDKNLLSTLTTVREIFCQETNNCLASDQSVVPDAPDGGCTDCNLTPQQKCNRWGGAWCDEWDCIQQGGTWISYDEPNGTCRMTAPSGSAGSANLCAIYGGHYCSGSGSGSGK